MTRTAGSRFSGFVYMLGVVDNSNGPTAIEAYGRERLGGKIVRIGRFLTGGTNNRELRGAQQHALVSDGRRVYATNPGSHTLSVLSIGHGGNLHLIQQVSSGGLRPVSIAIHGSRLYVANAGHTSIETPQPATVAGFAIRLDGSLARLPWTPVTASPGGPGDLGNIVADLAINPSGTALVLTGLASNKIDSFHIDEDGCLQKRQTLPGGGGAFAVNFRPGTDDAVIARALPEFFPNQSAPGIGSFKIGHDGRIEELDTYVDPDKTDNGLRDPCWITFAKDGVHFWVSSFVPRALNVFSLDQHSKVTRISEYRPTDSVPDPSKPGDRVVVGSFDLATDRTQEHLYQIRSFAVPDGQVTVPGAIHTYEITGNFAVNAGLREVQVTPLPADFENPCVTGLVFVDHHLLG